MSRTAVVDDNFAVDVEKGTIIGCKVEGIRVILGNDDGTREFKSSFARNLLVGNKR